MAAVIKPFIFQYAIKNCFSYIMALTLKHKFLLQWTVKSLTMMNDKVEVTVK